MKEGLLIFSNGETQACQVPDQSIYPQYVRLGEKVFAYSCCYKEVRQYREIVAPEVVNIHKGPNA
jgi:hypothetical protein